MPNMDKIKSLIPMHEIEQGAQTQIFDNANIPFVKTIAVMPDCHQGYDLPIGAVALVEDHISPSYVGYDIGCGMICYEIHDSDINDLNRDARREIFEEIKKVIPVGFTENTAVFIMTDLNEVIASAKSTPLAIKLSIHLII